MATVNYSKPNEVVTSKAEAFAMVEDTSLIVVMAIPTGIEDKVSVTYWRKDDELLPPWIITQRAA